MITEREYMNGRYEEPDDEQKGLRYDQYFLPHHEYETMMKDGWVYEVTLSDQRPEDGFHETRTIRCPNVTVWKMSMLVMIMKHMFRDCEPIVESFISYLEDLDPCRNQSEHTNFLFNQLHGMACDVSRSIEQDRESAG